MKEKIKLILKHKNFKYLILGLIGLFLINEIYNVYVDIYNFKQLDKAKIILNSINKSAHFSSLNEFNGVYNSNIKPIKNCYYVSDYNGKESYIFGFKLESLIYKSLYGKKYYAYPKYNIPFWHLPTGGCWHSFFGGFRCGENYTDSNFGFFNATISNPCKEDKE